MVLTRKGSVSTTEMASLQDATAHGGGRLNTLGAGGVGFTKEVMPVGSAK